MTIVAPDGRSGLERPSRTLRVDLAYEGTRFFGFGIQPNRRTVQEVVEQALQQALGERARVRAAGRTDTGVHAACQVLSLCTRGRLDAAELERALTAHLPDDVMILAAGDVAPDFDARRSALRRRYRYLILNAARPSLWWRRWVWHLARPLDLAAMQEATAHLLGSRDFRSFAGHQAQESAARTTVRAVESAAWWRDGDLLGFEITANAFLRHMVRGIVGTLVQVGAGRLDAAQFGRIVEAADRREAGPNAPPHGLMLLGVEYPNERTDFRIGDDSRPEGRSSSLMDPIGSRRATGVL